jgi:hypothetical protein
MSYLVFFLLCFIATVIAEHPLRLDVKVGSFELNLVLNEHLFADNFRFIRNGRVVPLEVEHCYYIGHIKGKPRSSAAISTCTKTGISGSVYDEDGEIYVVENGLVEYKLSDKPELKRGACKLHPDNDHPLLAQSVSHSKMGVMSLNPVYWIELFVVNDQKQCQNPKFGGNEAECTQYTYDVVNQMNSLFGRLPSSMPSIKVTLVGIENWNSVSQVPIHGGSTMYEYLDQFTAWTIHRQSNPIYQHDAAQLITGWALEAPVVGLAYVSTVCSIYATSIVQDTTGSKVFTSETATHELGHNMGSSHDGHANSCPDRGFIMSAVGSVSSGSVSQLTWSTCSASYFENQIQLLQGVHNCLNNFPRATLSGYGSLQSSLFSCGNGVLDVGEECDPPSSRCTDICEFAAGIDCLSGECCDAAKGKFKGEGTPCRDAAHQCDLPDFCSGFNATCPTDLHLPNGHRCTEGGEGSFCWNGLCRGLDLQCMDAVIEYDAYQSDIYLGKDCSHNNICLALYCRPESNPSAECAGTNASPQIMIANFSPCNNSNSVCIDQTCTPYSVSNCSHSCHHGWCSQQETCVCFPGWTDAQCSTRRTCHLNCLSRMRSECVNEEGTICGPCYPGYASMSSDVNTHCNMHEFTGPRTSFSNTQNSSLERGIGNVGNMFDDDIYSSWIQVFKDSSAWAQVIFETPQQIDYYRVTSGSSLPSIDPSTWHLFARPTNQSKWALIDSQTNQLWTARHQPRWFEPFLPGIYKEFRFVVFGIRSGETSSFVQVSELQFYTQSDKTDNDPLLSVGGIIGIVIGFLVFVILVALYIRYRK